MSRFKNALSDMTSRPARLSTERMSVVLALDISGSIPDDQLRNIQDNVNAFPGQVCENEAAADAVDVCVYTFADKVEEIVPWCSVRDMPRVELRRGTLTDLNGAALTSAKALRERSRQYAELGLVEKKPYLIIMTDGCDTVTGDVQKAADYIVPREKEGKLKLFFLGYGNYDRASAARLTEGSGSLVFEVKDGHYDFNEFFDFVANSVKVASVSARTDQISVDTNVGQPDSSVKVTILDDFLRS